MNLFRRLKKNRVCEDTQDFLVVEGVDGDDFREFVAKMRGGFDGYRSQLFMWGSSGEINIELFCSKDGKIYKGAEALYKIARTIYSSEDITDL